MGKKRKDKSLYPLNTDYDLYSMGPDGKSQTPLTAKASRNDIVRAKNGAFIGWAADLTFSRCLLHAEACSDFCADISRVRLALVAHCSALARDSSTDSERGIAP